jgi:DNA-binding transcriptional LysR family regulator
MELRHLRYFVAVAEQLSFTRAAEQLGIKQPPLSLQIRQLEKEMGTPLLRRLSRGVELTAAGKLFLEQARSILAQVDQSKIDVKRRGRGDTGQIVLGLAGVCYFHPLVAIIISQFLKLYPGVVLSPEENYTPILIAGVRAGKFDAAFVRMPPADFEGLTLEPIAEEEVLLALPERAEFRETKSLPLSALAKEKFVVTSRRINAPFYEAVICACQGAGFNPILGQPAPGLVAVIAMVAAGYGVSMVPQSLSRLRLKGVMYLPIKGPRLTVPINLVHRQNDRSPAVKNLVGLVRRAVQPMAEETQTV